MPAPTLATRMGRMKAASALDLTETLIDDELLTGLSGDIMYVNGATYDSGGTNTANISLTIPPNTLVGDLIRVEVMWGVNGTTNPPATVSGWTLRTSDAGTTSVQNYGHYWRFAQSGDAGTTVDFPLSTALSRQGQGQLQVWRNVDPTTPFDAADVTNKVGSSTSDPALLTDTSVTNGAVHIATFWPYYTTQASDGTWAVPSGWTQLLTTSNGVATAHKQGVSFMQKKSVAGAMAGFTLDVTPDPNTWMTQQVVLRPANPITTSRVTKTQGTTWNVSSLVAELPSFVYAAHRGGPGAEEALATYQYSYAQNPDFPGEGDATGSSNGVDFAIHDATVDRTADASSPITTGAVASLTAAQLDTVLNTPERAGESPQPLARWSAILDEYAPGTGRPRVLCIEIEDDATQATRMANLVISKQMVGSVIINTSTRAAAQAVQAVGAGIAIMFQTNVPTYANLAADGVTFLSVGSGSVTAGFVTTAHSNGIDVWAYTVNSTGTRDTMLANGADGIFSDDPAALSGVTRITKTTSTTWNVAARVAKTTVTTYDVAARVAKTTATTWNTAARVAKTSATTWDTAARVTKSTATTWNTAARVTKATSTTYDVAQRVTKTQGTTYDVAARVAKTTATTWDTLTRVAKTTATTWNTAQRVSKSTSTTWDVAGALTRISKTQATTWDVAQRVTASRATTWDTFARLSKTTATTWNVSSRLTKTQATSYDVAARVAKATPATWDTLARIVLTQSTTWDVAAPTTPPANTPPGRTRTVPARDRTRVVPARNRTRIVPALARILEVARTRIVPARNRTRIVPALARVLEVVP